VLTLVAILAIIVNERRAKMIRSINFSDDLYERLQKIAKEKEISVSSLIKMACKEYVVREECKQEHRQEEKQ
jgi:predicted transcriptional regulator